MIYLPAALRMRTTTDSKEWKTAADRWRQP